MDIGTHALASFVLMRAAFPRTPPVLWPVAIGAGILANADALSALFGPAAYLTWHFAFSHSLAVAVVVGAVVAFLYRAFASESLRSRFSPASVLTLTLLVQFLHLALDLCQTDGVLLFWPFSARRISTDWLPRIDPVILALLIAAIFLPELLRLVSAEIGAKDKKPHGQVGSIVALSLAFVYVGARATLHSNAVATLASVSYSGELPYRVAAFPNSVSLFTWNGIVETESTLHETSVNLVSGAAGNPISGVTLHKPDASPMLDTVRVTSSATAFLRVARFPKANIEKTHTGYRAELRDLQYNFSGDAGREVMALIELSPEGRVTSQELLWAKELRNR